MKMPASLHNIASEDQHFAPEPFASEIGPFQRKRLGDFFGLMQMGIHHEIIPPGSKTSLFHWHSKSEEFVYVLSGTITLVTEEGELPMSEGMCIGIQPGTGEGHQLVNLSDASAELFVVGTRPENDQVNYPNHDLMWQQDGEGQWHACHKNGEKY